MTNEKKTSAPIPTSRNKMGWFARSFRPFRTATLKGLAVILPPLLTIIFFIWIWNLIETYLLTPVESGLNRAIVAWVQDIRENADIKKEIAKGTAKRGENDIITTSSGLEFVQVPNRQWIPKEVFETASHAPSDQQMQTAQEFYRQYVKVQHLKRHLFIPAFLALFLSILYLLGKLLAAGIGRLVLHYFETLITRLPIIRNVYSSVKQVTDFALNENEMTFTRIVAVEYPRRGIWSMGFVTSEGMLDIRNAAGEPVLSVLMPTSPMPATGFTITVPKSQTIELNITIDQAVQFCVSCGVVVPDHQQLRQQFTSLAEKPKEAASAMKVTAPFILPPNSDEPLNLPASESDPH
jgi:uncharacterized membrane protein